MKRMMSTTPRKTDKPMVISGLELYRASRGAIAPTFRCGAWRKGPRKQGEQSRKAIREQY
jgi:hypothetical protein